MADTDDAHNRTRHAEPAGGPRSIGVEAHTGNATARADHADEVLWVYSSRTPDGGWWHPKYGDVKGPEGWEWLPSGDAYITRQVKQLGLHWVVVKKRKEFTQAIGLLAPADNIQQARRLAEETESRRKEKRAVSAKQREKKEQDYATKFARAVLDFLAFAPRHRKLAQKIAEGTARQATVVGSGRVGRTAKLELAEKAELAARAYIRHTYTGYEDRLLKNGLFDLDRETHHYLKSEAHEEVDEFLERHRPKAEE
ncbi:MAG: DUF2293 domain-containing protein [Chloroflexi bacterium]|nr:DUF2293 domain-containing protein [Chloroflexota bacterium]